MPIPACLASGPMPQVIHYLKVDDRWSAYIVEVADSDIEGISILGAGVPPPGSSKWMVVSSGKEAAAGMAKSFESAKKVLMATLQALRSLPECEEEATSHPGFSAGERGAMN